mmetsp:Transcript_22153/g.46384  ORF Transcript_22153/g.46384 Transcript_22153/m.46384 type:complete len:277 (+) Transcript_22153:2058-2888(+)
MRDEVVGRDARLPPRGNKDEGGLPWGVRLDGRVRRLVHGGHPRAVKLPRVALDVALERNGTDRGPEIEQPLPMPLHVPWDAHPVGKVAGVGQGRREAHNSHRLVRLLRDVSHPAHNDLDHGAPVSAKQVNLVEDDQANTLDIRTAAPGSRHAVPLLRRRDDEVCSQQGLDVRCEVAREFHELPVEPLAQTPPPILDPLIHQRLQRSNVNDFLSRVLVKSSEDGQLGANRLPASSGRPEQHVLIRVVQGVEDLGLNGVEVREFAPVQALVARVLKRL